jgi:hypothetical protein
VARPTDMHASRPTSSSDPGAFPVHECGMMCSTRRDRSGRTGVSCRLAVDRDPLEDLAVASRSPVRRRCALRSRHHLRPAASDQHLGQESERHRRHPVADSHRHTVRCPRQDRGADDPRTASARSNVRRQLHPGVVEGAGDECPGTHQNPSPVCGAEAERRSQWPGPAVDAVSEKLRWPTLCMHGCLDAVCRASGSSCSQTRITVQPSVRSAASAVASRVRFFCNFGPSGPC